MINITPLPGGLGARIDGLDLSIDLSDQDAKIVLGASDGHGLCLTRKPQSDDATQMRLSRIFGEMEPSATPDLNDPTNRFMMNLTYDPADETPQFAQHYNVGGIDRAGWLGWHWDQAFMPTIVRGAVLRMTHPARTMGRTGYIDAIAAYDRLSEDQKNRIDGLEVVYEFNPDFTSGQYGFPADIRALPRTKSGGSAASLQFPPVVHPMVITQYETGRKLLKLSPMHARYILGMDQEESDALLTEIAEHLVDPAHAYMHQWQPNDMLAWDNWRVIHMAEGVPPDCFRSARRTTIAGDYKVGRYLDPSLSRDREVQRIVD